MTPLEAALVQKLNDGSLELAPGLVRVSRVLNWGNFTIQSFHVTDGSRALHVKLTRTAEQDGIRRWMHVHQTLTANYHAPRVLAWLDLPGTDYGGIVFENIQGSTWNPTEQPEWAEPLAATLARLHADRALANLLPETAYTYRDCWNLRYREQFEQDLAVIRDAPPPFLAPAVFSWMERESQLVVNLPQTDSGFDPPARSPCHWDVWGSNVLLADQGDFFLLDWDDLALGDPALDCASLLWPIVSEGVHPWQRFLPDASRDPQFSARMELHVRALTLDYTIDVLADWVECDVPEWMDEVRLRKQSDHLQFLDLYRARWG